jgi:hypothetical protein
MSSQPVEISDVVNILPISVTLTVFIPKRIHSKLKDTLISGKNCVKIEPEQGQKKTYMEH